MKHTSRRIGLALGCSAILLSQVGCLTLLGNKRSPRLDTSYLKAAGYTFPPGGMPSQVGQAANDGESLVLEIRDEGAKPHLERLRLPKDHPMFVETLIQEAKIHERLGGVNVTIMRPTTPNAAPLRMDVRVKDDGKVKNFEENYALMPGDHVIVVYDGRTSLEVFFDKVRNG